MSEAVHTREGTRLGAMAPLVSGELTPPAENRNCHPAGSSSGPFRTSAVPEYSLLALWGYDSLGDRKIEYDTNSTMTMTTTPTAVLRGTEVSIPRENAPGRLCPSDHQGGMASMLAALAA
ncbi:hypothetical protein [Mesorhizobium sp. BR1-1-13]|uniref:hypothetical protein n=1 Tax=Mesorhizobium sp. BR1-1-13 TaxID=2876656 RepID=UPI001CD06C24|nr:hypothetical protein [Mesorhizobium sp. BR1-1-13]